MGFTRNYDNLVTAMQLITVDTTNYANLVEGGNNGLYVISSNGTTKYPIKPYVYYDGYGFGMSHLFNFVNNENDAGPGSSSYRSYSNLVCGPGTLDSEGNIMEETYDDYKITKFNSGQIKTAAHWRDPLLYNEETSTWSNTYHKRYNAFRDITIHEIGVIGTEGILLYRKVLDTPVHIPASETEPIMFEITFTQTVKSGLSEAYYDANIETYEEGEVDWS